MGWYWNMSDRGAAYFFAGQFLAVYLIGYIVGGVVWDSWATFPGIIVPVWPGIAVNLLWSFYNVLNI